MSSRLLALLLLLALATTACGTLNSPNVAATVGDTSIGLDRVEAAWDVFRQSPLYETELNAQGSEAAVERTETGVILGELIQEAVLIEAAQERELPIPDDADIQVELETLTGTSGDELDELIAGIEAERGVSLERIRWQVRTGLIGAALEELIVEGVQIAEEDVLAAYAAQPQVERIGLVQGAILEDAQSASDRINAGEPLATVAGELSIFDPAGAPGGVLGPYDPAGFPPELAQVFDLLAPDEASEPIDFQGGIYVLVRLAPVTLDEARPQIEAELREIATNDAMVAAIDEIRFETEIDVNPRFGSYDPLAQSVSYSDPLGALQSVQPEGGDVPLEGLPPLSPPVGEEVPADPQGTDQ